MFKRIVLLILSWQVRRLRRRHDFKLVIIAGSIGKTSTKFAVAQLLSAAYRVRFQEGNYNVDVTVPLVFFGEQLQRVNNPLDWLRIFWRAEKQIHGEYPYDAVVVELGTDGPGQLAIFGRMFQADVGVLTAVAPEHMEYFKSIDAVAAEELQIANFSHKMIVNIDLVDKAYVAKIPNPISVSLESAADIVLRYSHKDKVATIKGHGSLFTVKTHPPMRSRLYCMALAVAVAKQLGISDDQIQSGVNTVGDVPGRMQILRGIQGTSIIDDTYNASPTAAIASLDVLYGIEAPQRIALLGNMNELGAYSLTAHTEVGSYCRPDKLDSVVTIGIDANKYLAEAAEKSGCTVVRCDSPVEAANAILKILKPDAVILAKGSQNGVFAEEAVKLLLADQKDSTKLVRQSQYWMKVKRKQFKDMT